VSRAELIREVNGRVNAKFPYKTDLEIYGQPDFWERIGLG
jgi:predicted transglutaminase-like cysteine proteinase